LDRVVRRGLSGRRLAVVHDPDAAREVARGGRRGVVLVDLGLDRVASGADEDQYHDDDADRDRAAAALPGPLALLAHLLGACLTASLVAAAGQGYTSSCVGVRSGNVSTRRNVPCEPCRGGSPGRTCRDRSAW